MTVAPVTLAVLIAATLIIALLPFVLFRILRKPLALDRRDTIVGVAVFTLFAMIVERAFHGFVLSQTPAGGWLTQPLAFVAYSALATAVFEEVGRYLGMRILNRRYGASAGDGRGIGYGSAMPVPKPGSSACSYGASGRILRGSRAAGSSRRSSRTCPATPSCGCT